MKPKFTPENGFMSYKRVFFFFESMPKLGEADAFIIKLKDFFSFSKICTLFQGDQC